MAMSKQSKRLAEFAIKIIELVEKRALSNTKVQIEVQIRDTGIGIPERDQSRLFQASDRLMPVFPAVMVAPGWGW